MAFYGSDNDDDNLEDLQEQYGTKDGTIFVIDTTKPMFDTDPGEELSFFQQCIERYVEILKQKLVLNSKDWMGLVLFGTDEWDKDPETKYIMTLHKLGPISVSMLKDAMSIANGKWKHYSSIATKDNYPLYDVLCHAEQEFSAVKITMPTRRVVLLTCRDDPPVNDNEKHRVRVRVSGYNNTGLKFFNVGLGKNWLQEKFYKDLEISSGQVDEEDYQRTHFEDLVEQVKFTSRVMAKLPWRLGEDVTLDVSVNNVCVKPRYLKMQKINRETNEPVSTNTHFARESDLFDDEVKEEEEEENENIDDNIPTHIFPSEIRKMQTFGGRNIFFTLNEVRSLKNISEIGIDVICAKPIYYSPLYHFCAPFFVTCAKKCSRRDNELLFATLLHKCEWKELMIICMATFRKHSAPSLCTMIPDEPSGGFYLHCIPYREHNRDLASYLPNCVFEDGDKPPIDEDLVALFKKILRQIDIEYDPALFPNPKLQVQRQKLETIALDLKDAEYPVDQTEPKYDKMKERLESLIVEYNEIMGEEQGSHDGPPAKRAKKYQKFDKSPSAPNIDIAEHVKEKTVEQCTAGQLRECLKNVGLKTSGVKGDLVKRIYEHFG